MWDRLYSSRDIDPIKLLNQEPGVELGCFRTKVSARQTVGANLPPPALIYYYYWYLSLFMTPFYPVSRVSLNPTVSHFQIPVDTGTIGYFEASVAQ